MSTRRPSADERTRQTLLSEFKYRRPEPLAVRLLREILGRLDRLEDRLSVSSVVRYRETATVERSVELQGGPPCGAASPRRQQADHAAEFTELLAAGEGRIPWGLLKKQVQSIYGRKNE